MKYIFTILISVSSFLAAAQVKLLSLEDFDKRIASGKDTTFVINFWATWCAPCVEELPLFEKLQVENKSAPIKVILISVDSKAKMQTLVAPFVTRNNLKSEVFIFEEPDQQKFIDHVSKDWSGAVPATLVVNSAKSLRKLYEKEFNYEELKSVTINTI